MAASRALSPGPPETNPMSADVIQAHTADPNNPLAILLAILTLPNKVMNKQRPPIRNKVLGKDLTALPPEPSLLSSSGPSRPPPTYGGDRKPVCSCCSIHK